MERQPNLGNACILGSSGPATFFFDKCLPHSQIIGCGCGFFHKIDWRLPGSFSVPLFADHLAKDTFVNSLSGQGDPSTFLLRF